jgi:hypothetical protein
MLKLPALYECIQNNGSVRACRRPFDFRRANPISSIGLLFRLDRGMRRLAISHFLKNLGNSLAAEAVAFRLGDSTGIITVAW